MHFRVVQGKHGVDVVLVVVFPGVLAEGDQFSFGKIINPVFHSANSDPGHPADGMQAGPAMSLAPGAAHEIGIDFECVGIEIDLKYLVGQYVEVFLRAAVQAYCSTSVSSSIH